MIGRLIEPASSYAADSDLLFVVIFVICGFWFIAAEVGLFWLIFRFRHREGVKSLYVTGGEKDLKRWVTVPHAMIILLDVVIIAGAVKVWYNVKQYLPEADSEIRVVAQQWAWSFVHPGRDNQLGTADDVATVDSLYLENDKTYIFRLESRDVLHSFSVPAFRLKQDAIPGRVISGWFKPIKVGTYDLQCAEMCGIGHGIMGARVYVQTAEEHAAWLEGVAQNSLGNPPTTGAR